MLHGDGPFATTTLDWIRSYRECSSFEAFSPHITLGYGRVEEVGQDEDRTFTAPFQARGLAVCHLGNHCTCRRILWQMEIGDR